MPARDKITESFTLVSVRTKTKPCGLQTGNPRIQGRVPPLEILSEDVCIGIADASGPARAAFRIHAPNVVLTRRRSLLQRPLVFACAAASLRTTRAPDSYRTPRTALWTGPDNHATVLAGSSLWLDTHQTIHTGCHPKECGKSDTVLATIPLSLSILRLLHRDPVASDRGVRCCPSGPRVIRCLPPTASECPSFPGPMQLCCARNMAHQSTGQARQLPFLTPTMPPRRWISGPSRSQGASIQVRQMSGLQQPFRRGRRCNVRPIGTCSLC